MPSRRVRKSSRRHRRAAAAPAARSTTLCSCCRSRAGRAGGRDDRRGITALAQRAAWKACRNACDAHASDVGEARTAGVRSALLSQFERAGRRTGESGRAVQFFQCTILWWCTGMPAKFGVPTCSVEPRRGRWDRWDGAGGTAHACAVPPGAARESRRPRKLGAAMARYCLLLLLSLAWDATALVVTPAAARSTRAAPSRRREPLLQAADGAPDPEPAEPWCSEPGASASRAPRARRAHAAQFRVPPPHRAPPAQAARRAASWAGSLRSTRL